MAKAYDGHTRIFGVDTNTERGELQSSLLSGAVNRAFRGGLNRTRPPFTSMEISFTDSKLKDIFEKGAISGCFAYRKANRFTRPHILIAVNEYILKGRVYGNAVEFSELYKGIDPLLMHGWFNQPTERVYFQNGRQRPIAWDGIGPVYFPKDPTVDGMPIGTFMAYAQGRLVVFTEDGYAIVSDYIYGNGLKDTKGVESFIEYQQIDDLGAIGTPAELGEPMFATSVPQTETINGEGLLLVLCTNGAYTLNLTSERSQWAFSGIQAHALIGRGGASSHGAVTANNDIWYQSTDRGISSFKTERSEREKAWGDTSLSREVQKYLNFSDPSMLRFVSMETIHNRLLTTCCIRTSPSSLGGSHRFGQGMVALDFDRGSSVNAKTGFAWDGLWTGIRPIQLLSLEIDAGKRGFAVSHDSDGINRIYEIMPDGDGDYVDGAKRSIVSFYETPFLFEHQQPNEVPVVRRLNGGRLLVSDIMGESKVAVDYRPDYYPNWAEIMKAKTLGCEHDLEEEKTVTIPNFGPANKNIVIPSPKEKQCRLGSKDLMNSGYHFQMRVRIEGSMTVNILSAEAEIFADNEKADCKEDTKRCEPITLDGENLFAYSTV